MKNNEYEHQAFTSTLQKNIDVALAENRDLQRKNKLLQGEIDSLRLDLSQFLRKLAKALEEDKHFLDEEIPF